MLLFEKVCLNAFVLLRKTTKQQNKTTQINSEDSRGVPMVLVFVSLKKTTILYIFVR